MYWKRDSPASSSKEASATSLEDIKEGLNHWNALVAYKFYKSCLYDKLIALSLTARTGRAVKVQDYEVMVHKGFGSDKVVCGCETLVTLGQQKLGFLTDNKADSGTYYPKTPE